MRDVWDDPTDEDDADEDVADDPLRPATRRRPVVARGQ
jgi:hypothetical protein